MFAALLAGLGRAEPKRRTAAEAERIFLDFPRNAALTCMNAMCPVAFPPPETAFRGRNRVRPTATFRRVTTAKGSAMRVSQYLDLEDGGQLLDRARESWAQWTEREPRLEVVGFDELRQWLVESPPAEVDEVLHALATLAASDGGDDIAAAAALAWVLLPGACALTRKLRHLQGGDIQLLVAAQLWIEVRSFEWRRLRKVAANVLHNTRTGCLRVAGTASQTRRTDRTWSVAHVIDPNSFFWVHLAAGERSRITVGDQGSARSGQIGDDVPSLWPTHLATTSPERLSHQEVAAVLSWACDNEVISESERELLLCLVEEAGKVATGRFGRANYGLTANEISARVAPRCGLSPATVRRRVARSIQALSAAADRYVA